MMYRLPGIVYDRLETYGGDITTLRITSSTIFNYMDRLIDIYILKDSIYITSGQVTGNVEIWTDTLRINK